MNNTTLKTILVAFIVTLFPALSEAYLVAGKIDPQGHSMFMAYEDAGQRMLVGNSQGTFSLNEGVVVEGEAGTLFIVKPAGDFVTQSLNYFDPHGVRIAPPLSQYDKVIYVDAEGSVVGGLGLSWFEMKQIVEVNRNDDSSLEILQDAALAQLMKDLEDPDAGEPEDLTPAYSVYKQIKAMPVKNDLFSLMNDIQLGDDAAEAPSKAVAGALINDLEMEIFVPEGVEAVTTGTVLILE